MSWTKTTASVVTRLIGVMCLTLVILLIVVWVHHEEHHHQAEAMITQYSESYGGQVNRIIGLSRASLMNFIYDYSLWDEMVYFAQEPTEDTVKVLGDNVYGVFQIQWVWILNRERELVAYEDYGEDVPEGEIFPLPLDKVLSLLDKEPFPVFFMEYQGTPVEVAAARLYYSEDSGREGEGEGYLIAARPWGEAYLASLADLTGASIRRITGKSKCELDSPATNEGVIWTWYEGNDLQGEPAMFWVVEHQVPGLMVSLDMVGDHSHLVIIVALVLCAVFFAILIFWVILPLRRLGAALDADDHEALRGMSFPGQEWERLAQLIASDIQQREALSLEITMRREAEEALVESEASLRGHHEERERLARDLHDGVIQSVYATGLLIETAAGQVEKDPEKTRHALKEARHFLNVLIADLRRFLAGLGPVALQEYSLRNSLQRLLSPLKEAQIAMEIELDDLLLNELTPSVRMHLYFIVQELIGNCIRHARPRRVAIACFREGDALVLTMENDGVLPAPSSTNTGNGLKNIGQRAESIGAQFIFNLGSDHTARATIKLPLTSSES